MEMQIIMPLFSGMFVWVTETVCMPGAGLHEALHRPKLFTQACQVTLHQGAAG